ncbi:MAG: diaminopropionate ammonia-lyase [Lachnospiraceae bacterium]|nr:diaminopropionate ammonia-lyase [Lachnospiraceae bacterium]
MKIVDFKKTKEKQDLSFLDILSAERAKKFHQGFPVYKKTPLALMAKSAETFGVKKIYVKDESFRFGLNAFKVLGGSFAIGNYIAQRLGLEIEELTYQKMIPDEVRKKLGDLTFVTATDGNHGRGVAWAAKILKQSSVIYMPKGSSLERLNAIKAEGAKAYITEYNYDGSVALANQMAEENGWIMIQDTAWEGYTQIPTWIIEGYSTMALEAYEEMNERPTHIFIQAGVGSLAAAITGFFSSVYKKNKPIIVIVEPYEAACIFKSAKAKDGQRHFVKGDMNTIMAGLACGEPCSIGWDVLKSYADYALTCSDDIAKKGMRLLANPIYPDQKIISGESGAVCYGCVAEILTNPKLLEIKSRLGLTNDSVILTFSTEGATDMESYRNIVG